MAHFSLFLYDGSHFISEVRDKTISRGGRRRKDKRFKEYIEELKDHPGIHWREPTKETEVWLDPIQGH